MDLIVQVGVEVQALVRLCVPNADPEGDAWAKTAPEGPTPFNSQLWRVNSGTGAAKGCSLLKLSGPFVATPERLEVVAALPHCAGCTIAPPPGTGPWLVKHEPNCAPEAGGAFYVRDRNSGFPPRQA